MAAEHQTNDLKDRRVIFTGKLASMSHREARALVQQRSGEVVDHMSRRVDLVVVGEEGWPLSPDGGLPRLLQQAGRLKRLGLPLEIISETEFLTRLGLIERHNEVHRHYTPAMLARILNVPVTTIRQWQRRGLIRPIRTVLRLAYFDFQEVAGAKVLARLLADGVATQRIQEALRALKSWLPGAERPLTQVALLAEGRRMLVRRGDQLVEATGQRLFDFAQGEPQVGSGVGNEPGAAQESAEAQQAEAVAVPSAPVASFTAARDEGLSADDWFAIGSDHEEENQLEEAIGAYHHALLLGGPSPEVSFQLANTLYRQGQPVAAAERYRNALEIEPDHLEAWNNLGSVLAELGRAQEAVDAFRCALAIHDDYADAHYNLADTLEEMGHPEEALPHWHAYLCHDTRSPWADEARRRLDAARDASDP